MNSYSYHVWANQKIFQRLYELPREVVIQEVQSVFPSVYTGLIHIC